MVGWRREHIQACDMFPTKRFFVPSYERHMLMESLHKATSFR